MDSLDPFTPLADEPREPSSADGWPLVALLLGGVGALLGLILTLVFSTVSDIDHLAGGHLSPQRGLLGLLAVIVSLAGAFFALSRPGRAAILLVVASGVFFFAFHLYGLIASPFLLIAALLLLITRGDATPSAGIAAPPEA